MGLAAALMVGLWFPSSRSNICGSLNGIPDSDIPGTSSLRNLVGSLNLLNVQCLCTPESVGSSLSTELSLCSAIEEEGSSGWMALSDDNDLRFLNPTSPTNGRVSKIGNFSSSLLLLSEEY